MGRIAQNDYVVIFHFTFFAPIVLFFSPLFAARSYTVCETGCDFASIAAAISAAEEHSRIIVKPGFYREALPIVVNKPLSLEGDGWPRVEGDGQNSILVVTASDVSIRGMQLENSGISYLHELAGIRVENSARCALKNNRLINNSYGIYLAEAEACEVSENHVEGHPVSVADAAAGNGIHLWHCRKQKVANNEISGHRDGIYLEFTDESAIEDNKVINNLRYGLHFMTSHRNEYRGNRFEQNGAGVAVMYSHDVLMRENTFANNRGMASYGLLLKDITAGRVIDNLFADNTFGIYMEGTNRTAFSQNRFANNGYGLRVMGNCDDNTFQHNNFVANTFDVATNSSRNPNTFMENYWSHYEGYDLDSDGVGDVPFRPVSLSSVIVEKVDSSFSLIKSPFLQLLDEIEQVLPMLIPETLKDERPLMNPWRGNE